MTSGLGVPPKFRKLCLGFRFNFKKSRVFSNPPSTETLLGGVEKTPLFPKFRRNPRKIFKILGGTPNPKVKKSKFLIVKEGYPPKPQPLEQPSSHTDLSSPLS